MIPKTSFNVLFHFQLLNFIPTSGLRKPLKALSFILLGLMFINATTTSSSKKSSTDPVNAPPVLAAMEGTTLTYSEGQAATAITTLTTVTDADNANLTGATITINSNYVNGEDLLAFTNAFSITGSFDATSGTMTLTGTTTLANYRSAIRAVTYRNSNTDNPSPLTRTVRFTVTDGTDVSNIVSRNISVAGVNDAPVLSGIEGTSLAYSEEQAATIITSTLSALDVDNINLASATVQITLGYSSTEDVLAFTNAFGITGAFNTGTGILTLTGPATVADFQSALQTVTYVNTNIGNPSTTTRTVVFKVNDGTANSATLTRTITITPVNDAPALTAIEGTALSYSEGQAATSVTGSTIVTDVDNANISSAVVQITGNYISTEDILTYTTVSGIIGVFDSSTGSMTLTGSATKANYQTAIRTIKYQNTNNNNPSTATRTVSFTINDGALNSAVATRDITVAAINDIPVLTTIEATSLAYAEDQAATIVTSTTTITDVDNTDLVNAIIQISSNYSNGQDVLAFTNTANITGTFDTSTGTLTLTGTATVAEYQTAIQSITYENTNHLNPSVLVRKVSFKVNDGTGTSAAITRNIAVTTVNDAPVADAIEVTDLAYSEGQAATVITATTTVADGDNVNLAKAFIQITGNYLSTEDILSFTNAFSITGSYSAATGILTLSGNTTLANYQSAIRTVKYRNSNNAAPSSLTRTVTIILNDGALNSIAIIRNIIITPVDDAPTVVNDAIATAEENAVTINVLANDSDVDDSIDPTTVAIITNPINGTVSVDAVSGAVTYTPGVNFSGTNTFTYTVKDLAGTTSAAATVTITVNNINDAPIFIAGPNVVVNEDAGTQTITLWATGIDDGDPFTSQTVSFVVSNNNGGLFASGPSINAAGTLTFKAKDNASGVATVTVAIKDNGLSTPPNVNQSANQTFTISVLTVNDAPVGVDDFFSTSTNSALKANLSSNDTDLESNTISASPTTLAGPFHGTVTISSNGNFVYTPDGVFTGTDTFTYEICDNGTDNGVLTSRCGSGVVSVTVNPPNPYYNIVGNNSIQISQDCFILTKALNNQQGAVWNRFPLDLRYSFQLNFDAIFSDSGVVNDVGADGIMFALQRDNTPPPLNLPGSPIDASGSVGEYLGVGGVSPSIGIEVDTYQNTAEPAYDHIAISKNGSVYNIIAPAVPAKLDASNNPLNIEDGVSHTVNIGWDKPTNTMRVSFDGVQRIVFTQNIIDSIFGGDPTHIYWGFSSSTGGKNNYQGVCGITMTPINLPALAVNDTNATPEDAAVSGNVMTNDSDPEEGALTVFAETKATTHGTVVIHADGTYTYTPTPDYNGTDSFIYQVCDQYITPGCNNATVTITITPVSDNPVASADSNSTNEDIVLTVAAPGVLVNDIDVDGDVITAIVVSTTTHGTLVLNANGSYNYTPAANYFGSDSFSYQANDGVNNSNIVTVSLTVAPVNDAPDAIDDTPTVIEDIALAINVLANDVDIDNAIDATTMAITIAPTNGTATINATTGVITYAPDLNYNGSDSFSYTVKDVSGAVSDPASVIITITPVNDAPVAANDIANTPEDNPVVMTLTANDTDIDNALNLASLVIVNQPMHGSVSINNTTSDVTYTPAANYNGSDSFTYTIKDVSGGTSNTATVAITITPVDDPPTVLDNSLSTLQNTATMISVPANATDIDDAIDLSSLNIILSPLHGTISINQVTGVITYTPMPGYLGNDTFTYRVNDVAGSASNVATVTIVVVPPNQPPVAVNDGPITYNSVLPFAIDVLANDSDPDNVITELQIVMITTPTFGTVEVAGGKIVYHPEGMESGTVTFNYTIQDPGGLTSTATVTIQYQFRSLKPSEGFSPNNDGNNDTWYITSIERYPDNDIHIFDRWGILVYKTNHYNNESIAWDGRANTGQQSGTLVDQGTYYYTLNPGSGLAKLSGYIQILR